MRIVTRSRQIILNPERRAIGLERAFGALNPERRASGLERAGGALNLEP